MKTSQNIACYFCNVVKKKTNKYTQSPAVARDFLGNIRHTYTCFFSGASGCFLLATDILLENYAY